MSLSTKTPHEKDVSGFPEFKVLEDCLVLSQTLGKNAVVEPPHCLYCGIPNACAMMLSAPTVLVLGSPGEERELK